MKNHDAASVDESETWLPIKSAPKDGFHIQLYRPEIQFVGYWAIGSGKWVINAPGLPIMDPPPTMWRPCPAMPKQK